jgi:hypothetical protein
MASIEATEAGTSLQARIAQSSEENLDLCADVSKTMVGTVSLPCSSDPTTLASLDGGQEDYGLDLDSGLFFPDEGFAQYITELLGYLLV